MKTFTGSQQNVIDFTGQNMLVSASAGTGKTTVMVERIAKLISDGIDVSEMVIVTFTNLAAAEMKNRLASRLAENHGDKRIVEQLEKLDTAAICTMHSFCVEILRSRFYVVDIDPSFVILDSVTSETLCENALDETFHEYFKEKDETFKKVYKIFATKRKEENFKTTLKELYNFSRCLEDFDKWYQEKRQKFLEYDESNPIIKAIMADITQKLKECNDELEQLANEFESSGGLNFANNCRINASAVAEIDCSDLPSTLKGLYTLNSRLITLGRDKNLTQNDCRKQCDRFSECIDSVRTLTETYSAVSRGREFENVWEDTKASVELTDKLVEIIKRFDQKFSAAKKQRGGVDFNDLEHLTLQILKNDEAAEEICKKYRMIFVDEYQDTNPVQEAIITRIARNAKLFMVGDVKQSIYAFRGCDPTIFLKKYHAYKAVNSEINKKIYELSAVDIYDKTSAVAATSAVQQNCVVELNQNFRSNSEILYFINSVFDFIMTEDLGEINYRETSQLEGDLLPVLSTPSVQIDLVVKQSVEKSEADEFYDITSTNSREEIVSQGDVIAQKIAEFVGMTYIDKSGKEKCIGYGDIVILLRGLKATAVDIYNKLIEHNIPVAVNFKTKSFANKEVRDIVTLLRVIDNPYNDIYAVGACLSPVGGFTQNDLAEIKIDTADERIPFYMRMHIYLNIGKNKNICEKINCFFKLMSELRLYSYGATVDEVVLKILNKTNFHLYVQGFPNGTLRLQKLYSFIDSIKDASFSQSISKFLYFLDQSEVESEDGISTTNAVRMMTMHAAKGLEFPIVILANTEHYFNFDMPAVSRHAEFGLAMKFYNFDEMRVYETLGTCACGMFNRKKVREEEMRLLYVAMTRAQFVLDIVGTVSENRAERAPTSAMCHLDWILAALSNKYGDWRQTEIAEKLTFYSQKPQVSALCEELLCPQYTDSTAIMKKIDYVYPFAEQTKMPGKIVSSALDREYIDVDSERADVVLCENSDRNELGTAYHRVFQYVDFGYSRDDILHTINGLINEDKINRNVAEKLDISLIFANMNNSDLRKIVSGGKVFHEMPFMLMAPYNQIAKDVMYTDNVMLQGVIDLLVLHNNKAVVVDYKYSSHPSDLLQKDYCYQLESYRLAVQKICGFTNVESYILSIKENKLIKMNRLNESRHSKR